MPSFQEVWKSWDCFIPICFVLILFESLKEASMWKLKYEEYVTTAVWGEWHAPSERRL